MNDLGLLGLFDPASELGITLDETDFGITLARWGVPEGSFLVLPLLGPTTMRDVWRMPVDGYFFDPLSNFARNHDKDSCGIPANGSYLITLRSSAIDAESFLKALRSLRLHPRRVPPAAPVHDLPRQPAAERHPADAGRQELDDPDKLLEEQEQ